ncbi:MAG: hypothetical protein ACREQ5_07525 [Candidatus Dormibacteria bacterium]
MIQRLLNSKNFVAFLLTAATGMALYFYMPFPERNVFLQLMAIRAPLVFQGVKWSYSLFLFSTPYIIYSILLSGLYIFALKAHRKITAGRLPRYPDPRQREDVFLVVGEVHNPRKAVPSETPRWLIIPATWAVHRHGHHWRGWNRQDELLHVSLCRTACRVQGFRP